MLLLPSREPGWFPFSCDNPGAGYSGGGLHYGCLEEGGEETACAPAWNLLGIGGEWPPGSLTPWPLGVLRAHLACLHLMSPVASLRFVCSDVMKWVLQGKAFRGGKQPWNQARGSAIPDSKNFPQCVVIHTVKGLNVVNEAEVDVFLKFSCFFYDPTDIGNLTPVPLPFLNPAWTSGSSQFTNCWSLARTLSITLLTCEMSAIVQ